MGHAMGRVHMQKQDLNTMNLMKFKVSLWISIPAIAIASALLRCHLWTRKRFHACNAPFCCQICIGSCACFPSGHKAQDFGCSPLGRRCCGRRRGQQRGWCGRQSLQEHSGHSIRIKKISANCGCCCISFGAHHTLCNSNLPQRACLNSTQFNLDAVGITERACVLLNAGGSGNVVVHDESSRSAQLEPQN